MTAPARRTTDRCKRRSVERAVCVYLWALVYKKEVKKLREEGRVLFFRRGYAVWRSRVTGQWEVVNLPPGVSARYEFETRQDAEEFCRSKNIEERR